MKTRKSNGEGSCRKIALGKYECVIQSNLINPKTLKPKRFMRRGATEKEARLAAIMAMQAWEKEYKNNGNDINFKKTRLFGEYMTEYMESKVKGTITDSAYYSYYKSMQRYFHPYRISKFQLQNLSVKAFQDYYDEITQKYSKKTCSLPVQLCRRLCKDLVNRSLIRTSTYCKENKDDLLYPVFRKPYRARSNSTMEIGFKTLCNVLNIDRGVQQGKNGIKGLCLHSLRHTFITYANTASGNNSLVVSMMAGHQQWVNENIYTHENIEAMAQIQTPGIVSCCPSRFLIIALILCKIGQIIFRQFQIILHSDK